VASRERGLCGFRRPRPIVHRARLEPVSRWFFAGMPRVHGQGAEVAVAGLGRRGSSAEALGTAPQTAQEQASLALERSGYRRVDRLRAAARAVEQSTSTALAPASSTDFDWIWAEVERLTRFSARRALTPRARKLRRWRRSSLSLALLVLLLLIGYRLWGRPRAEASAIHSEPHAAKNAIDGLEATEWLLPDGTSGWVDVLLPTTRTVHGVRLLNAHNVFYADRGARDVRVTAFTERGPAASVDGAFAAFSETRSALDLPLEARDVTRIRVEVLSYFKSGGGLAEIEIK
jgi:hypothetical protein